MIVNRYFLTPERPGCYYLPSVENQYLTKSDVLAYLKISRFILEKLMRQGLPHIKLDRRVLFRKDQIDAFLESRVVRKGGAG